MADAPASPAGWTPRSDEIPICWPYTITRPQADEIRTRLNAGEFWIAVDEDWGWREWIWLPGMSRSEFLHWWVTRAGRLVLPGEFVPALPYLVDYWSDEELSSTRFTAHIESTFDTVLTLPPPYGTKLPPACATPESSGSSNEPSSALAAQIQSFAQHLAQRTGPQDYWDALTREILLLKNIAVAAESSRGH